MSLSKSGVYITNSIGPTTDPWGILKEALQKYFGNYSQGKLIKQVWI